MMTRHGRQQLMVPRNRKPWISIKSTKFMSRRSRGRRNVPERVFIPPPSVSPSFTSSVPHLRAIHTFAHGQTNVDTRPFRHCAHDAHTTRVYCVFFLLLLLDNVYAPEARQTNRRSTCVLMNAVFDLEWWTPSGLRGFKRNEISWKSFGGDFVCNTVPWVDLMRIRGILGYWRCFMGYI